MGLCMPLSLPIVRGFHGAARGVAFAAMAWLRKRRAYALRQLRSVALRIWSRSPSSLIALTTT